MGEAGGSEAATQEERVWQGGGWVVGRTVVRTGGCWREHAHGPRRARPPAEWRGRAWTGKKGGAAGVPPLGGPHGCGAGHGRGVPRPPHRTGPHSPPGRQPPLSDTAPATRGHTTGKGGGEGVRPFARETRPRVSVGRGVGRRCHACPTWPPPESRAALPAAGAGGRSQEGDGSPTSRRPSHTRCGGGAGGEHIDGGKVRAGGEGRGALPPRTPCSSDTDTPYVTL